MQRLILIVLFFAFFKSEAQLVVGLQTPPLGVIHKPQLWPMMLTNTTGGNLNVHIELNFSEGTQGNQVFTAVTKIITLPPGTTQINANYLSPIQYNNISPSYSIDQNPNGHLPIGYFTACFSFIRHVSDAFDEIAEQCTEITVEPMGPPHLVYPYDGTGIEESNPLFTWLPPVSINFFSNLEYDFILSPIFQGQSAADALQENLPLFQQQHLTSNALSYPASAPALELNKPYAWGVVAKNGEQVVGVTETWQFTVKKFGNADSLQLRAQPFVKLKKDEEGYAIFTGELKFEYLNEVSDSLWAVRLWDLSAPKRKELEFSLDSFPLSPGFNQVKYSVTENAQFIDKHLYLLEVTNSRDEKWRLQFQYRTPVEQN